jgi:hypothetical protein
MVRTKESYTICVITEDMDRGKSFIEELCKGDIVKLHTIDKDIELIFTLDRENIYINLSLYTYRMDSPESMVFIIDSIRYMDDPSMIVRYIIDNQYDYHRYSICRNHIYEEFDNIELLEKLARHLCGNETTVFIPIEVRDKLDSITEIVVSSLPRTDTDQIVHILDRVIMSLK